MCCDSWVWLRKTRPLGVWIFRDLFLWEVLWGGYTAGKTGSLDNCCPGRYLIIQPHKPQLSSVERCWRNSTHSVWWAWVFWCPKRKMPVEQSIIPFRSYKLFALILPAPCNSSNNNSISTALETQHRPWQANYCKALAPSHVQKWNYIDPELPWAAH